MKSMKEMLKTKVSQRGKKMITTGTVNDICLTVFSISSKTRPISVSRIVE